LIVLLNKLATPPFYANMKTDSDVEFYKESKYAKIYKVFFNLKKQKTFFILIYATPCIVESIFML